MKLKKKSQLYKRIKKYIFYKKAKKKNKNKNNKDQIKKHNNIN
jgi:hypothetical protein